MLKKNPTSTLLLRLSGPEWSNSDLQGYNSVHYIAVVTHASHFSSTEQVIFEITHTYKTTTYCDQFSGKYWHYSWKIHQTSLHR